MLSLSVQLITLKCYPGFLGLFPVKEKKEKTYAEPFSSTDNTQMLSWFPRFDHSERRRKEKENLHWAFQFDDTQMLSWFPRFVPCERKKKEEKSYNEPFSSTDNTQMLSWLPRFVHSERRRREKGKPMLSLSVWLLTLKCYPGFLGLFTEKEERKNLHWAFQFDWPC